MSRTDKKNQNRSFSMKERVKSFSYAFRGIRSLLKYEHNARIHLAMLIIVIVAGIYFRISVNDWMVILIVSGLVFVSECFNTAIENISDLLTDKQNENIGRAKDVAAAGVLISAIVSLVAGLIIFLPEIMKLLDIPSL